VTQLWLWDLVLLVFAQEIHILCTEDAPKPHLAVNHGLVNAHPSVLVFKFSKAECVRRQPDGQTCRPAHSLCKPTCCGKVTDRFRHSPHSHSLAAAGTLIPEFRPLSARSPANHFKTFDDIRHDYQRYVSSGFQMFSKHSSQKTIYLFATIFCNRPTNPWPPAHSTDIRLNSFMMGLILISSSPSSWIGHQVQGRLDQTAWRAEGRAGWTPSSQGRRWIFIQINPNVGPPSPSSLKSKSFVFVTQILSNTIPPTRLLTHHLRRLPSTAIQSEKPSPVFWLSSNRRHVKTSSSCTRARSTSHSTSEPRKQGPSVVVSLKFAKAPLCSCFCFSARYLHPIANRSSSINSTRKTWRPRSRRSGTFTFPKGNTHWRPREPELSLSSPSAHAFYVKLNQLVW
jgi:hypothetical protein